MLADDPAEEAVGLLKDLIEIKRLEAHHVLAAEHQQLAGEGGRVPFALGRDDEFLEFHQVIGLEHDRHVELRSVGDPDRDGLIGKSEVGDSRGVVAGRERHEQRGVLAAGGQDVICSDKTIRVVGLCTRIVADGDVEVAALLRSMFGRS